MSRRANLLRALETPEVPTDVLLAAMKDLADHDKKSFVRAIVACSDRDFLHEVAAKLRAEGWG